MQSLLQDWFLSQLWGPDVYELKLCKFWEGWSMIEVGIHARDTDNLERPFLIGSDIFCGAYRWNAVDKVWLGQDLPTAEPMSYASLCARVSYKQQSLPGPRLNNYDGLPQTYSSVPEKGTYFDTRTICLDNWFPKHFSNKYVQAVKEPKQRKEEVEALKCHTTTRIVRLYIWLGSVVQSDLKCRLSVVSWFSSLFVATLCPTYSFCSMTRIRGNAM